MDTLQKKSAGDVVRALAAQGKTADEIRQMTGLKRASIGQYLSLRKYEQAAQRKSSRPGNNVREICEAKKQDAREMFRSGARITDVINKTGISYKTAARCRGDVIREDGIYRPEKQYEWPVDLQIRWVVTVNRIRTACGMEPFPVPGA